MSEVDLVVVGLGYVGLPLAREACLAGMSVIGLDVNTQVVERLNGGHSHVDDLADADIGKMVELGFRATTDPADLSRAETVVVCVPTPLGREGGPDLTAVSAAGAMLSDYLTHGTLVSLESTTWPGTTEEVFRPLLEMSGMTAGSDFHLAFSPERIDPGNKRFGLRNTPKVVAGLTEKCRDRAAAFYSRLIDEVVVAKGLKEAEMSKLLENTYRHVNIALVNEMAKFSHDLGIDIWDVIKCSGSKPFGFQSFFPGPGVGGHCIPIDPNYLSHHVQAQLGYPFRFVELAQEINESMPAYVMRRAQDLLNRERKSLNGSDVLLLGVTYKSGIADQRESPSRKLAERLVAHGAEVNYYDPFVDRWSLDRHWLERVGDLGAALKKADIVIHLQSSDHYPSALFQSVSAPVLDTRGVLSGPSVVRL